MPGTIVLDGGVRIAIDGQPPQGSRHRVLFGVLPATGEPVAVKLEETPGALARERVALQHLAAGDGPAPALRAAGHTDLGGERVACLVVTRHAGAAPTNPDGWRRMGRALGRLADPVGPIEGLPIRDAACFAHRHAQRVHELGDRVAEIAAEVSDWPSLSSAQIPWPGPLVLAQGDPGPGNFLDDGHDGCLIDWEDAQVAPRGLDLARVAFIARLGSGPEGFVGRDHAARARAAVAGYLQTVPGTWRPGLEETRWWLAVAGVQFIHHRWRSGGRPGPWEQAADVLRRCLMDAVAWA